MCQSIRSSAASISSTYMTSYDYPSTIAGYGYGVDFTNPQPKKHTLIYHIIICQKTFGEYSGF